VRDVYRLFVFDLEAGGAAANAPAGFDAQIALLAREGGAGMGMTLTELFAIPLQADGGVA
jgi:hypothetical protein